MTRPRDLSTRLLRLGRLSVVFEPRDVWLGLYVAPGALYVCLVPCLPLRWQWRKQDGPGRPETPPDADGYLEEWMPGAWR